MRRPFLWSHRGGVGFAQVAAAAEAADAGLAQVVDGIQEGLGAEVARVVVGHGHRVETPPHHAEHAGVGPEGVGLARQAGAAGGNRALQVGDAVVGLGEQGCHRAKRVAAGGDQAAGSVVEHHVAGKDQADAFITGPGVAGEEREAGGEADQVLHRRALPKASHQYSRWPL